MVIDLSSFYSRIKILGGFCGQVGTGAGDVSRA